MKSKIFTFTTALSLLVGLAVPVQLAAQNKQDDHHKHHHYKLIDIATLGGPESHFNPGSGMPGRITGNPEVIHLAEKRNMRRCNLPTVLPCATSHKVIGEG